MKRVAPTDLPGPHCVRTREAKECVYLLDSLEFGSSCRLYKPQKLKLDEVRPLNKIPLKCDRCNDALTELEDR